VNLLKKVSNDDDYELWRLLNITREVINSARDKELDEHGITSRQVAVLYAIHIIGENATPAEISRFLRREPNTISVILNRMADKGLIKQSKDLPKRNMIRINITPKGKEAFQLACNRRSIHRIFANLSHEENKQMETLLNKLLSKAYKEVGKNV
jgi:MarR family multiple antibiotic resistance transcriptional regulator